jgi:hypothetical protein
MLNPVLDQYLDEEKHQAADTFFKCLFAKKPLPSAVHKRLIGPSLAMIFGGVLASIFALPYAAIMTVLLGLVYLAGCFITRLIVRRTGARNQRARQRIYKLLGSIGATLPSPTVGETARSIEVTRMPELSGAELALLEETVQAHILLIEHIDTCLDHLRSTTAMDFRLGASCPNIERIERAALKLTTRVSSGESEYGTKLSLSSLRRALAGILCAQLRCLQQPLFVLTGEEGYSDDQRHIHQSQPAVVTITWIRTTRNHLAAALSVFVAEAFDSKVTLRRIDERLKLLRILLQTTQNNVAYLEGALYRQVRTTNDTLENMSTARLALQSLQFKVRTLQIFLSDFEDNVDNSDSAKCYEDWTPAIQLIEDIETATRSIRLSVFSENFLYKNSALLQRISSGAGTLPPSTAATACLVEYVTEEDACQTEAGPLIQDTIQTNEVQTVVYVGKGAHCSNRASECISEISMGPIQRMNPALVGSLVNELKQYLQSLPTAHEVEAFDELPNEQPFESDDLVPARNLVDAGTFVGELCQAMSRFRQATEFGEVSESL